MVDIAETLQRKVGPLPVWAWGGVVGGGVLIARTLTGGGGGGGASSPFTQPLDGGMNFDPGAGGGNGDGGGALDWLKTLPGGQTVIDRPPGDITILPGPTGNGGGSATPTPTPTPTVTKTRLSLTGRTAFHDAGGKVIGYLRSGTFDVIKTSIGNRTYWKVTSPGSTGKWQNTYIHATSDPTYKTVAAAGDTRGIADSFTPVASGRAIGYATAVPLGSRLSLPVFDAPDRYSGPTIDADIPIASGARIDLPSISAPVFGHVPTPDVPTPDGMPIPWDMRRIVAPLRGWADRVSPRGIPTTLPTRYRLTDWNPIVARFRDRLRPDPTD